MDLQEPISLYIEQRNTLRLIDCIQDIALLPERPVFEICGGTGLLLNGIESIFTVDIDVVNPLDAAVKKIVTPFISDMASEVVILPANYKSRLKQLDEMFVNIDVYFLSLEDIIILKLMANRVKDREDLRLTEAMFKCNWSLLTKIITEEMPQDIVPMLLMRADRI